MAYVLHCERERIVNKRILATAMKTEPSQRALDSKDFPQLFPAENGSTGVVLNVADVKKKKSTQAPPQFPDGLGNISRAAGGEGEEAPPAVPPHASHLLPKQGAFSQSFYNIWRLSTFHGTSVLSQSAQLTQTTQ